MTTNWHKKGYVEAHVLYGENTLASPIHRVKRYGGVAAMTHTTIQVQHNSTTVQGNAQTNGKEIINWCSRVVDRNSKTLEANNFSKRCSMKNLPAANSLLHTAASPPSCTGAPASSLPVTGTWSVNEAQTLSITYVLLRHWCVRGTPRSEANRLHGQWIGVF